MKSITNEDFHISSLKANYRIGIDASCWLHKSFLTMKLTEETVLSGEGLGSSYIDYFMSLISTLRSHGINEIIVVFDGLSLDSKLSNIS